MEKDNKNIANNRQTESIYDWIPDTYTIDEKNEIIRLINEYADICVSILEHSRHDKE
jgi:hypothetical protein